MKIIICIIAIIIGTSLSANLSLKKTGIVPFANLPQCKEMSQSPATVTGHFASVYNDAVRTARTKCAPHPEVYAYTTEAFKVINCFLRSTLSTKVTMPQYAKDAIKGISASLRKPFTKGDIITNLPAGQTELYRFSDVYDLANLKVGHLWSNLAYMSTAITAGANSQYRTATNYAFTFKTSHLLVGKLIQKCSAAPGEAEFLCDAGQCWNITSVSGHNVTFEQVACVAGTHYADL